MAKQRNNITLDNGHFVKKTYDRQRILSLAFIGKENIVINSSTEAYTSDKKTDGNLPLSGAGVSSGKRSKIEDLPKKVQTAIDTLKKYAWTDILSEAKEFEKSDDII